MASKFGTLFKSQGVILPDSEVMEQASGSLAAAYTTSLVEEDTVIADLTAGMGVNTYFFSKVCKKVYAVEKNPQRALTLQNNLKAEGVGNVAVINADCNEWVKSTDCNFHTAYLDPSRRDSAGKRKFLIEDCSPDLNVTLPLLSAKCSRVLVKVSPLLDISRAVHLFPKIRMIHILESAREVKELILDLDLSLDNNGSGEQRPLIRCAFLSEGKTDIIDFKFEDVGIPDSAYVRSKKELEGEGFIYEPSPAIMKAGKFGQLIESFGGLKKFSPNSHLFYSKVHYPGFPGRVFQIKRLLHSSDLKRLRGERYNVVSRNHPAHAAEITDRFKFKSSESSFIIASTIGLTDKVILATEKI